jgi:hypothetical protein
LRREAYTLVCRLTERTDHPLTSPTACMHTLRSAYLTSYARLVKPPYTSDPFAAAPPSDSLSPVLAYGNRETRVLDLYIALKVREDVWMDETELHLERDECFKDLFDLMQVSSCVFTLFFFTFLSSARVFPVILE